MERNLLHRIEAFLAESRMPPSVFGRAAAHDPRLVSDLRPEDWHLIWPELADSEPKPAPVGVNQAPVAIDSEAKEAARVP